MKTLFLYAIQISMFCSYTCIFGIPQPHPDHDSSRELFEENVFKTCEQVNGDINEKKFLNPDILLCFGLKVFSQPSLGGVQANADFDGIEKKYDKDICKHFQEMRLNSTLEKLNESAAIYNKQFRDKSSCERACLDVSEKVNPLCSMILFLSHNSKGNPIGSGTQVLSTTLPGDKADSDNNEVSGQSRNHVEVIPNKIPVKQKPKATDQGQVINEQVAVINNQEQIHKGRELDGEDESPVQKTDSVPPERTSQAVKSLPADRDNVHGQTQQSGGIENGSVNEKPKATSEENTMVSERVKEEHAASGVPEDKVHVIANNNTFINTSKKTTNSKQEQKEFTVEDTNSVTKNENEAKSDGKQMEPSSVVLPKSSGGDENENVTAIKPKLQGNINSVDNRATSKKVLSDTTGLQKEESNSQVPSVKEDKDIVNGQKPQADNKVTDNFPQKEAELQTSSKTITEVIPKSKTDEQKTSQNNGRAYTDENAETAPQLDQDDTQRTVNEETRFTGDTGDGVAALDTQFSVEPGESNGNTEFTSGGGTGLDYDRAGSDALETDKSDMNAGTVVNYGKYEDDDSHFFAYFMTTMVFCIVGYLLFHNKQKILALALEGRARRGRRRPNTSGYRKLDSNLEEAISSSKSASVTQVIY